MESELVETKNLLGKPVVETRTKKNTDRRIGKVRRFVFHPSKKRCIGVIIKRPDVALMWHRSDLFLTLDGMELRGDDILMTGGSDTRDDHACKRLGVNWDECVLWEGMELITESGTKIGTVGNIGFDFPSGKVRFVEAENGATAKLLLGMTKVPASMIAGFRYGIGEALRVVAEGEIDGMTDGESDVDFGAILLSDEVLHLDAEGGLAEKAGKGTAIAADKGKRAAVAVKNRGKETIEASKPLVSDAGKAAGEAVDKGSYALGKQVGRASGMFSGFMDEFRKASSEDEKEQ